MADWEAALDKQLATWLWWDTPQARMIAQGWVTDTNAKYDSRHDTADRMLYEQRAVLWHAEPIYVTREMGDLLRGAWTTFEPEPLREEDLIVPHGFALLPYAFDLTDVWGRNTTVRAIGWHTGRSESDMHGLVLSLYCNADDRDDYTEKYEAGWMQRVYGEAMPLVATTHMPFGQGIEEQTKDILAHRVDADKIDVEQARMSLFQHTRLLQCFWRLTQQRVAVGMQRQPGRGARRRSERVDYKPKYVTVVTLRRPRQQGEADHRKVDWQMRWIVSGHWRWQPYGDGTHRQIWISPYVKGPEDKALVVRGARVFRWAR